MSVVSERQPRVRIKVVEEIIESLRQEIVSGRLSDGSRLPNERDLAARFGVSQPTIREAIRALETLGLVEAQHGSGTFVRGKGAYALALALQTLLQIEGVGIVQILDVRQILGLWSIRQSARDADEAEIARVARSIEKLDQVNELKDIDEIIFDIIEFQRSVSAACRNPLLHSLETFLVTLLIELQVKTLRRRGIKFWRNRVAEFQVDRRDILEALVSRSEERAVAALERYFGHQRALFESEEAWSKINLSDPRLIETVAQMVQQMKNVQH